MKNNKSTAFIIIAGVIVLIMFTAVLSFNFISNKESSSYYVKVGSDASSKIENVNIVDGKLVIETSENSIKICVKSTKSKPTINSLCWKDVLNNSFSISIYNYKKYYIWIKDSSDNISNYVTVNAKENIQEN